MEKLRNFIYNRIIEKNKKGYILSNNELKLKNKNDNDLRLSIDDKIDEVVNKYWEGDLNLKKLLRETVAQESHYGKLDRKNPFQLEEMKKLKYTPALGYMGVFRKENGDFNISDLKTNIVLGAMRYLTSKGWSGAKNLQSDRAKQWKEIYNTNAGKGTEEKFIENARQFNLSKEFSSPFISENYINNFG